MLSQRTSTIKPKTSASKRISNIATGRSRLSSTTNNSNSTSNSKTATMEKINNTNSLAAATASQDRESFKVIPECGQDIIMAVDCNVSELSILKMLEGDMKKDGDEDFERKKLREELDTVKKDLAMKNVLVERLMKENSDVRREMNDLLGTLDSAKEQITLKLQVYTARIQELEGEVKTLKYENKLYQEQLQKVVNEKNSRIMEDIDGCVGKYYQESKQKLELFYKSLNYQVAQFLEMSRDQYESLGGALLNCVEGPNRIASVRNMNRAQTPDKTRSPLRSSISKSNLTLSPQPKGRGVATPAASGRDSVPRSLSNYDTDRRRRLATLHNLNDLAAVNIRVESSFGSASSKNEWSRKSPKDLFSPKMKNEPFRINTQPLDEKRE